MTSRPDEADRVVDRSASRLRKEPGLQGQAGGAVTRAVVKLADANDLFRRCTRTTRSTTCNDPAPADLVVAPTRTFPDQIYSSVGDFRTHYLFFDVTKEPVRQARGAAGLQPRHRSRRDQTADPSARRAFLPTPGWHRDSRPPTARRSRPSRSFDVAKAKEMLADGGYSDPSTSRRRSCRCATHRRSSPRCPRPSARCYATTWGSRSKSKTSIRTPSWMT